MQSALNFKTGPEIDLPNCLRESKIAIVIESSHSIACISFLNVILLAIGHRS